MKNRNGKASNQDFGVHVSLWTRNWSDDYVPFFAKAAELGFGAVEVPLLDPRNTDTTIIQSEANRHGLKVYCGTGLGPDTDVSSLDKSVREKGLEHLKMCIDLAAELESPTLEGVLHSAWGKMEGISEDSYKYSAEALHEAGEYAGSFGMRLCLECLNRYESAFLNTVDQGLGLIEQTDAENIGLHLDTYHMNIEEKSIAHALKRAGNKLYFFHLSENDRGYPGNGSIDWKDVSAALKDISYKGPLVIESYVLYGCETGDGVGVRREIEPDTDKSLEKSLRFLQGISA